MLRQCLCCAALLSALVGQAQAGADDFDRVVSFGDSLSDNGNLDAASLGTRPGSAYFEGRFSNGPTFAELLAGDADFASGASSQQRFWGPLFSINPATVNGDVNLAVGGKWAGANGIDDSAFPASLQVDYVRVCQRGTDATPGRPTCGDSQYTPK